MNSPLVIRNLWVPRQKSTHALARQKINIFLGGHVLSSVTFRRRYQQSVVDRDLILNLFVHTYANKLGGWTGGRIQI
jgi:predicted ABC-type ATPase